MTSSRPGELGRTTMTIRKIEEITVYESPDGGKTVYSRKVFPGESTVLRNRILESVDPVLKREQEINQRWVKLKEAVWLADTDATLNDAIMKVEVLYALKRDGND